MENNEEKEIEELFKIFIKNQFDMDIDDNIPNTLPPINDKRD